MNKFLLLSLSLLPFLPLASHADQNLAGNVTVTGGSSTGNMNVTGSLDIDGPIVSFGTIGTSTVGNSLIFSDSTATSGATGDTLTFSANRTSASWLWLHNASKSAMRLNSLHQLLLYQADGSTSGITLTPASNQISFGSATLTGSGINLIAGGAFTVTGPLTASSGITNTGIVRTNGVGPANGTVFGSAANSPEVFSNGGVSDFWFYTPSSPYTDLILANSYSMDSTLNIRYTPGTPGAGAGVLQIGQLSRQSQPFTHGITQFFTNGAERMRIDSTGRVGIGATNPASLLQLKLNINDDGGVYSQGLLFETSNSKAAGIWANQKSGGYGELIFGTNNTGTAGVPSEKVRITKDGNVGIGTATPATLLSLSASGASSVSIYATATGRTTYFGNDSFNTYSDALGGGWNILKVGGVARLTLEAGGNSYFNIGNVGIGTSTPATAFDIGGGASYINGTTSYQLFNSADKVVQIRGANQSVLSLLSDVNVDGGKMGGLYFGRTVGQADAWTNLIGISGIQRGGPGPLAYGDLTVRSSVGGELLRVRGDTGNVGIGTTNPTQKLSVAGTVRAYAVVVDTGWSDYVFDKDYRLAPLSEVEQHIKAEKHLPGIPSASEVAEHGVSLGDMQSKLLAKVEELTLHLIAQEKEIAALRQQVTELRATSH